ncbi:integral membrane protein [Diaporthe helianthi]|uniref:Integral membrane protein n=1 Tax=Diaporthe helianthi TaxID=158607 RepID=A0A2P5HV44_DIAHE|nr:integral membrane protein [Diaporthe helianthi]
MSSANGVVPVIPAPEGYPVDFSHPKRQGVTETYWIVAVGNFLALLFLGQKIYTKTVIDRRFQIDDACHVAAWVTSIAIQVVLSLLVATAIYAPCTGFAKLTLFIFYRRLSPQTWFRRAVHVSILLVISYTTGIFFSVIFACTPVEKSWDIAITTGSCINRPALYISTAVLTVSTDTVLLLLPVPMVLKLQMPPLQKAGLLLMFAIGSLTMVTSIIRLKIILRMMTEIDRPWVAALPGIWICIEANLMIICGSFPTIHRFFRQFAPRMMGEASANSGPQPGGSKSLRTFGDPGPKKRRYDKFGESVGDLDIAVLDGEEQHASDSPNDDGEHPEDDVSVKEK